ncbi:MAG: glycosyltransferase family 4 protein, partial [Nanoarchaeota archaeon]|nr:glycosyltransferase family 4 protein [Nanoarchaeota archaeon]
DVFFCKCTTKDRKWKVSLKSYKDCGFKWVLLKVFNIWIFMINYTLPFKFFSKKYDLYLVNDNASNVFSTFVVMLYAKLFRKPLVIWSEALKIEYSVGLYPEAGIIKRMLLRVFSKFVRLYRQFLYSYSDALVGYSQMAKETILGYGIPDKKVFYGIQIMPLEFFKKSLIKKDDTTFKDKKVILYMGYLRAAKGIQYLIKAFMELKREDACLVIAGSGPDEDRLKSLAQGSNNIYFPGHVSGQEKAKYYSLADIFVLPTFYDSWGLVINEAMYYGLPIILTYEAGSSQMIKENKNGFVVEAKSSNSLRQAIFKLLKDDKMRTEMSGISAKYKDAWRAEVGAKPFVDAINYALFEDGIK